MKKFTLTTSLLLSLSATTFAADVTIPNSFTAGSPAVAADVNANFSAVETAVDDNNSRVTTNAGNISTNTAAIAVNTAAIAAIPGNAVYDYRNYLSTASSKTFATSGTVPCGNVETRSFVRTTNGANTDIEMTRVRTQSSVECSNQVFRSTNTPTERLLKEKDNYDNGGAITRMFRLSDPVTLLTSNMSQGAVYSDASPSYETPAGGSEVLGGVHVQNTSVTGTETVTVPLSTYNNCLKVAQTRYSRGFGGDGLHRVSWYCAGVGEVKRIEYKDGFSYGIWELTSITP